MSEPFLGEIRMVGFNFPPRGWAECDGQTLSISQNSALFSLFGTIYGGDGETNFRLPDLRSRVPIHEGSGPGLSPRTQGEVGGAETVSGVVAHTHSLAPGSVATTTAVGNQANPDGHHLARANDGEKNYSDESPTGSVGLGGDTASAGSNSVSNMPPFLTIRFVVALQGLFPSS